MKKFIAIALFFLFAVTLMITAAKCQPYLGGNAVQFETYTDSISNEYLLDCYNSGDTMSFRLRMEEKKGFKSVLPYISFKNQAAKKGITVKFMVCIDDATLPVTNLANITALKNAGCYVTDVELFNEFYSNDPDGTKGTCSFDFACYKSKFLPQINAIKAAYPNTRFFFCLAPRPQGYGINGERGDHTRWNDSIKNYIASNPFYHITYHLYFNAKDCDTLSYSITPQVINGSYNKYLDDYYAEMRRELYASTLMQSVDRYLKAEFPNKLAAYTEVGIIGGDPERGNTASIRNTYVYADFIYYLLTHIDAYEIDIHALITLAGIISPASKLDIGTQNIRRFEYYSLYLTKFKTQQFCGAPYYYSSIGATEWTAKGSTPFSYNPLGKTGLTFGIMCRDTSYFVNDTSYVTIQVANPIPVKCSRFFYSLFHGKECTVTYHSEQQMILTEKLITKQICN